MATNQYLGDGPISGVTHRVVISRPINCVVSKSHFSRIQIMQTKTHTTKEF